MTSRNPLMKKRCIRNARVNTCFIFKPTVFSELSWSWKHNYLHLKQTSSYCYLSLLNLTWTIHSDIERATRNDTSTKREVSRRTEFIFTRWGGVSVRCSLCYNGFVLITKASIRRKNVQERPWVSHLYNTYTVKDTDKIWTIWNSQCLKKKGKLPS